MELAEFVSRLDDRLDTDAYSDVDASANGLQVGPPEATIDHAAFAVDAAEATISAAADVGADALVVHHGLSWGGIERVTDRQYDRIAALVDANIALYVSHLPLDGHQALGNAAVLADQLGLTDTEPFGTMGPVTVGQQGTAPASLTRSELTSPSSPAAGQIGWVRPARSARTHSSPVKGNNRSTTARVRPGSTSSWPATTRPKPAASSDSRPSQKSGA